MSVLFENPQNLLYTHFGALLLGWLVAKFGSWVSRRTRAHARDPRDDRIRSLDAELRIARNELGKAREEIDKRVADLADAGRRATGLQTTIDEQSERIAQVRKDLKESILKTNELRAELSERATENLKSEVKLREVETELSVVQASSDLIATGILDYTINDEDDDTKAETKSAG